MTVQTTTLKVDFVSESAAYESIFGWYNKLTGAGGILFSDVEAEGRHAPLIAGQSSTTFTVNTADLGNIEFFLIPNGANLNDACDLTGPIQVIRLNNGTWAVATVEVDRRGRTDLEVIEGAGANAFFTETSKNAGGVDYASGTVGRNQTAATLASDTADGVTGLIAWEDLAAKKSKNGTYSAPGDADYNDAVFRVSVVSSATPPVARADTISIGEDAGSVQIDVLANDSAGSAGGSLVISAVSPGSILGTVSIAPGGQSIVFTPSAAYQSLRAGQTATETFTYTVIDGFGGSATAQATVTITGANDAAVVQVPTIPNLVQSFDPAAVLSTSGLIGISDPDAGEAGLVAGSFGGGGALGSLVVAANGAYTYSVSNAAVQYLTQGQTLTETFTVSTLDGTSFTISFTIVGQSDAAVIGSPTVSEVTEDVQVDPAGALTASGVIAISDPDAGEARFVSVLAAADAIGHLALAQSGAYTYAVSNAAVQYLRAGQSKIDTFTVTTADGSTRAVSFTIHGADDVAVIGVPSLSDVTEDVDVDALGILAARGSISIQDPDQGQSSFSNVAGAADNLGSLVLAADGAYTYAVANSAVQYLGAGESKVESFTIVSADGTTKVASFTIHGANDAAEIGAPTVTSVTEDVAVDEGGNLTARGSISIQDSDQGQALFSAVTSAAGNLGSLALAADGSYTYAVANGAVQYLGAGESKIESFTIQSMDGTQRTVSFIINGSNDAPTISGRASGSVQEDNARALRTSGVLTATDPDGAPTTWSIVGGTTTASTQDFRFQVDNLKIVKNGNLFFEDSFGDGNPPPSSPFIFPTGPATYATNGTFTEAAGRAFFDGTEAVVLGTAYGERMTLITNANALPDTGGLKRDSNFSTEARFDLIIPEDGGDAYGVRLVDQPVPPGNQNSSVDLVLLRNAAGVQVALRQINLATSTVTILEQQNLPTGSFDQIIFRLSYQASSYVNATTGGKITASFDLLTSGAVTASSSFAAQGTIFQGEDFTRVQLIGQSNQSETGVYKLAGTYGTLTLAQDGQWHYFLADHQTNVQALGPGQTATDTFTVRADDGHGGVTDRQIDVTIFGTIEPVVAVSDALAINENGVAVLNVLANDLGTGLTLDAIGPATVNNSYGLALGQPSLAIVGNQIEFLTGTSFDALGAGQFATVTVPYTVREPGGQSASTNATITIVGVNDAPISDPVGSVSASLAEDDGPALTASGLIKFSDADVQDTHAVSASLSTTSGPLSSSLLAVLPNALAVTLLDPATGDGDGLYRWDFSLDSSLVQYLGAGETLLLNYRTLLSDTAPFAGVQGAVPQDVVITIVGANDAPIAYHDSGEVIEAGTLFSTNHVMPGTPDAGGNILLNASEPDGDPIAVVGLAPGATSAPLSGNIGFAINGTYGALTLTTDGVWGYHLDDDRSATHALAGGQRVADVFTYTLTDFHGGSVNETITIDVVGTNDAPAVAAPLRLDVLEGSGTHRLDLLTGASDAEGDAIHVVVDDLGPYFSLENDGHTLSFNSSNVDFNLISMGQFSDFGVGYDLVDSHGFLTHHNAIVRVVGTDDAPAVSIQNSNATIEAGGRDPGIWQSQALIDYSDPDVIGTAPDGSPIFDVLAPDTAGWTQTSINSWIQAGTYGTATWIATSPSGRGILTYELDSNDPDTVALNSSDNVYDTFRVTYTDGTLSTSRDVSFEVVGRNDMYGRELSWQTYFPTNLVAYHFITGFTIGEAASFVVNEDGVTGSTVAGSFFEQDAIGLADSISVAEFVPNGVVTYWNPMVEFTRTQVATSWFAPFLSSPGTNYITVTSSTTSHIGLPRSGPDVGLPEGVEEDWISILAYAGDPFNGYVLSGLPTIDSVSVDSAPLNGGPVIFVGADRESISVNNQGLFHAAGEELTYTITFTAGTPINAPAVNQPWIDVGATDPSIGPSIAIGDGATLQLNVAYSGLIAFEGPTGTLKLETPNFTGTLDGFSTQYQFLDLSAFTDGNANIIGELDGGSIAPHSVGWVTSGADAFVYVNGTDFVELLPGADASLRLHNVTQLSSGNFIV